MNTQKIISILEIGNLFLRCIVAKIDEDDNFEIIGKSISESKGFDNGSVINLNAATESTRKCIADIEQQTNISIKKIFIIFESIEFLSTKLSKYKKIGGSKIDKDDISFLLKEAKNQIQNNNLKEFIIHIFNFNYIIDKKKYDKIPIDIYAEFLKHDLNIITVSANIVKNLNQVLIDCDIEVEKFISSAFALGVECLNENELKLGSTIIDIGYEKITIAVFNNSALAHLKSYPIGSNHITKDISRVCSLSLEESENIKKDFGLFLNKNKQTKVLENNHITKDYFKDSKFRKISIKLIQDIIKARVDEIFELSKNEIIFSNIKLDKSHDVYFLGGGSLLKNLSQYGSEYFLSNIKSIDNITMDQSLACSGALKSIINGFETEAIAKKVDKKPDNIGLLSRLLGFKS